MAAQQISAAAEKKLAAALKHFGGDVPIHRAQVVKARIEGTDFVLLWNRGINGIAKDRILASALRSARIPKPKPKAKSAPSKEA